MSSDVLLFFERLHFRLGNDLILRLGNKQYDARSLSQLPVKLLENVNDLEVILSFSVVICLLLCYPD